MFSGLGMINVLYVDDEAALLDVGKQFLELSGDMVVDTVTTARNALLKMSTGCYDAVISDYQMPETNGIDFLKLIRAKDEIIPFILFTGRGREEVVIEALNSGADFYIQKGGDPCSQFKELEHKVKEAVRRNRAEEALKLNEARLIKAQEIGGTGCWELNLDSSSSLLWGSVESFRMFGIPRSKECTVELSVIESCIQERKYVHQSLVDLIEKGTDYNLEYHIISSNGSPTRIVRSMAELIKDPSGRPFKVIGIIQDITERKRAEVGLRRLNQELMAIKKCNEAMIRDTTEPELVKDICDIVCDVAGYRMAWIGMAEHDEKNSLRPVAWSGLDRGYVACANVTWGEDVRGCGAMGTAIKTARTVVMRDMQNDPTMRPWREFLIDLGYRSMIAIPIIDSGIAFGAFGIYIDDPEGFSQDEIELLEEMTGDLAFGILGLRAKERQHEAEEALRKSEERFRTLFAEAPMAMSISLDGNIHQFNRRFLELFGGEDEENFKDRPLQILVAPREREKTLSLIAKQKPGELLEIKTVGLGRGGSEFSLYSMFTNVNFSDKQELLGFFSDTTELDHMQLMVIESEEKCRTFIERSPLAFLLSDPAGLILEVNHACCELIGYNTGEMIGRRLEELRPSEGKDAMKTKVPTLGSIDAQTVNCTLRRKNGQIIAVHIFLTTLPNGNIMAFIEDVTERLDYEERLKKNEEELRKSEHKFRTIFDRAALGIVTSDTEGRLVDFNQRFLEIIGYPREEITKKSFAEVTHPDDLTKNLELFASIKEGKIDGYDIEKRYVRKDGSVIWIHLFVSKLVDPYGHLEKGLIIIEDITERKLMSETLRESEEQFSKLVAAIPDFVIVTDMRGIIVLVNEVTLASSGYVASELVGRSLFSFIAPDDVGKALRNTEMMINGRLGPVEYQLTMKDGSRIVFEANGDVLRDPSGTPTGMVFVGRDLTERRQLETRLRDANRRLRVMDCITRHDTINKITALQGYIDLIKKGEVDLKDLDRLNRMDQIVGFLMDQVNVTEEYQKIGMGNPEWQSVTEVCNRAASLMHLDNVTLTIDVGKLEILADPLLHKVFYNLMDNSLRHGVRVDHITVTKDRYGDNMKIVLSDNGVGISQDDKMRLFKEGYGKVHGLGLFLSREILDITGIAIMETGKPGNGARFEMIVPKGSFRTQMDWPMTDA